MPQRKLFPGQETHEVKMRLPAPILAKIDEGSKGVGHRSKTVATALTDFYSQSRDQMDRLLERQQHIDAILSLDKDREQAEAKAKQLMEKLKEERKEAQNLLRSVRMTLRNMPLLQRRGVIGLMQRVKRLMTELDLQQQAVEDNLARVVEEHLKGMREASMEAV